MKRGINLWCPSCKEIRNCNAKKQDKILEKYRRINSDEYKDINWFRRFRICNYCNSIFITGEIEEEFIRELIKSRKRMKNILNNDIELILKENNMLSRAEFVPKEIAIEFLERTAWWVGHPVGPVRAEKHAERIEYDNTHGYFIQFGSNRFLVGKAIERIFLEITDFFNDIRNGEEVYMLYLIHRIEKCLCKSVANLRNEEYKLYPISYKYSDKGDLLFGTQSIDLEDTYDYIFEKFSIEKFLL